MRASGRVVSVHRAHNEAVDIYVNYLMAHPAWGIPDLRHRAVRLIWLGPAAAKVVDNSVSGDIVPLCADPNLIVACAFQLFDGPPFIVTENVPVRSPATSNLGCRLHVAFPPEVLGIIRIDAGWW
jgi:hypothetical protein